jgi:cell division transport system permease protein
MSKFSYVLKNTLLNMRRTPLLVFATIIAVLVSSFLVFTTLSARSIVENNTLRWQNGVHVVVFLDDRVTTTAHKQLQESLESYPEVRTVDYFSKQEAEEEFKVLFKDQPELLSEVDYEMLPSSLRINLNDPSDYTLIIERLEGNPAVKEIRSSGEAIERLLSLTDTLVISASAFALLIGFAAFILIINTLRIAAFSKKKEIRIMRLVGASSTYIRLPFIFEAVIESLIGTSIAVGFGWAVIEYSKNSIVAESIFDITISDDYLIFLTLSLLMFSLVFGLFASFVGISQFYLLPYFY